MKSVPRLSATAFTIPHQKSTGKLAIPPTRFPHATTRVSSGKSLSTISGELDGVQEGVRRADPYHVKIQDLKPAGGYK